MFAPSPMGIARDPAPTVVQGFSVPPKNPRRQPGDEELLVSSFRTISATSRSRARKKPDERSSYCCKSASAVSTPTVRWGISL
jgi:hypothetical protein